MTIPAVLNDGIGLVNFTLTKGIDKRIRLDFATTEDISTWSFEAAFYAGQSLTRTKILSTSPGTGITVSGAGKYLIMDFTAASISAVGSGIVQWDLRYDTGTANGQLAKGRVTIGTV